MRNLQRTLKNSSVPVPKTLLRMILNATLPRLLQRTLLVALPPELGQYLLACKQDVHIAGADLPQVGAMTTHSWMNNSALHITMLCILCNIPKLCESACRIR